MDRIHSCATVTYFNFVLSKNLHQHKDSKVAVKQAHMQSKKQQFLMRYEMTFVYYLNYYRVYIFH